MLSLLHRRFRPALFILLMLIAQQQALVHPYVHAQEQQQGQQQSSNSQSDQNQNDQSSGKAPAHSETCLKCVALANIHSAVGSQAHTFDVLPGHFELWAVPSQPFYSATTLSYRSRAPPSLA